MAALGFDEKIGCYVFGLWKEEIAIKWLVAVLLRLAVVSEEFN